MATKPPPTPKSPLSKLLPLLLLFLVLFILLIIGYIVFTIARDVSDTTSKKMQKKNVTVTKDGMRVGVKEVGMEKESDGLQNVLVKTWNLGSGLLGAGEGAVKRRFWEREGKGEGEGRRGSGWGGG